MFNILNILLVLALLFTIVGTVGSQQPMGPEGPVGGWILLLFPCLFLVILFFVLAGKGLLDFIPGGRAIQILALGGILVTFGAAMLAVFVRHDGLVQGLLIAIPYLILAGFAGIIHHSGFSNPRLVHLVTTILLGGATLAGWGLAGWGIVHYVKKDLERSALRAQKDREQEQQREQWEIDEYAKLADSASLSVLLRFTWSRNTQVRQQARERISRFPGLDDNLIELLDQDYEEAISYIAKVYENPPGRLAPAWGNMLERELKKWDSLQYDEYAGKWEPNLRPYFEGARKIQLSGGSLHDELQLWHQHLQKCKGLGGLANFVESLL